MKTHHVRHYVIGISYDYQKHDYQHRVTFAECSMTYAFLLSTLSHLQIRDIPGRIASTYGNAPVSAMGTLRPFGPILGECVLLRVLFI